MMPASNSGNGGQPASAPSLRKNGDFAMWRRAALVLIPSIGIILLSFAIIRSGLAPSATRFLDNLQWTVSYAAAAAMAWLGARHAGERERTPIRWFAIALSAQAAGQLLWDIQVALDWNPFPGPSDALYILLGPCCAAGLWASLQAGTPRGQKRTVALDVGALCVTALAFMLAFYLPRRGGTAALPLAILIAYPVALLSAASIGVIHLLTLRIRGDWRWLLFFVSLVGSAIVWMRWNSLTLENALEDGSWFNFSFTVVMLGLGLGAMVWRAESSTDPRWERFCEGVLRLLPVLLVVGASASVIAAWTIPDVQPGVRVSTSICALLVSILAMARQSILLSERGKLLVAEQRIRESERQYRTLFESAQDAILIMDDRHFLDCNQSTSRMFARERERIIGREPADLSPMVQADGKPSAIKAAAVIRAALDGTPQFFEWRHKRDDGTLFDTEVSLNRIDLDGRALLQAVVRDVTERKRGQEQMRIALEHEKELAREAQAGESAKSEFLAMMSHEIRTPMNGILGFAELASQSDGLPPDCQDYLRNIITSGEALQRILDDILDFSRMEAGRLPIDKTEFDPAELVENVRFLFAHHAQGKGLELRTSIPFGVPLRVEGDEGRLRQILINLAGNAIKFTERGSVTLGLRTPPERESEPGAVLEFFVEDTGPGIPPEKIDHIFELFTQVDSAMSRRHGGTGLGLTIAKRLALLMGGDLAVTSQHGKGARFVLTVPLGIPETPVPVPVVQEPMPSDDTFAAARPLRILVAEDDSSNRKLILAILNKLGYFPLVAHDGAEAVRVSANERPDCILMDIQMPEMDGIEATQKIREAEATTGARPAYICALTANVVPADRVRCFEAGMNAYLNKPLKRDQLAGPLGAAAAFAAALRAQQR
jgi:PAS domain S-box-containing protein